MWDFSTPNPCLPVNRRSVTLCTVPWRSPALSAAQSLLPLSRSHLRCGRCDPVHGSPPATVNIHHFPPPTPSTNREGLESVPTHLLLWSWCLPYLLQVTTSIQFNSELNACTYFVSTPFNTDFKCAITILIPQVSWLQFCFSEGNTLQCVETLLLLLFSPILLGVFFPSLSPNPHCSCPFLLAG